MRMPPETAREKQDYHLSNIDPSLMNEVFQNDLVAGVGGIRYEPRIVPSLRARVRPHPARLRCPSLLLEITLVLLLRKGGGLQRLAG